MHNKLSSRFQLLLREPSFGFLLFVILRDSLVWVTVGVAALFSLETILPGMVAPRFNLAYPLILQILLFLGLAWTVNHFHLQLPQTPRLNRFIAIIGLIWFIAILLLSLLGLSLLSKIGIFLLVFVILWLIWKEYISPRNK